VEVIVEKKSEVKKNRQTTPEPTDEKPKLKKSKKSKAEVVQDEMVVQEEVVVPAVNKKKRKADDEEADASHINKKANVEGVAVATAKDNGLSKSAQKRNQDSATKLPSAARAFRRVKVEEVKFLLACFDNFVVIVSLVIFTFVQCCCVVTLKSQA